MPHRVMAPEGKKVILLGNEAIVRGALEAGIGLASCYPGTPSSEIGDTYAEIARDAGIYFEYSTNEKVAFEVAAGAAMAGVRSMVSFKHFGFNVASDSIFPLVYHGIKAGIVIVSADDPGCWSSGQNEQDNRAFARMGHMPLLEPSDPAECRDFVKLAYEISEKWKVPVLFRTTTRVSHASGIVKLGKMPKPVTKGHFEKDAKLNNMPPKMMHIHDELHEKLEDMSKWGDKADINYIVNDNKSDFGIITSGVCFHHVMESLEDLKIKVPVLKLGMTYPMPREKIRSFIKGLKTVFIVEELEPIMESYVHAAAKDDNHKLQIYGKNILPIAGEIRSEFVTAALDVILGKAEKAHTHTKFIPCATAEVCGVKVPPRTSTFCPGCPHRATYWAVKTVTAGKDVVFGGDVGCYVIGMFPPYETQDWLFAMGASGGLTHGIKKVSDQKVIAFYGDSTFFHSGMPPIANAVYNKGNVLFIILDNSATAMTGHQPHPGTGRTGMGDETKKVSIAEVAKALGVDNVATISAWNIKAAIEKIREFLDKPGVSLIVSEGECRLQYMRKVKKLGVKVPMAWIDPAKCKKCGTCVEKFSCPAIHKDGENYYVDTDWCWGCAVCPQICPNKAISMKQYDKPEAKPAEKKKKNNKG